MTRPHTSRAPTSDKNLARVRLVMRHSILNHIADSLTVTASTVGERGLARHVPAGATVGATGPHSDISLCIGSLMPRNEAVLKVSLRVGLARVDDYDHRRVCHDFVGNVDVPECEECEYA